ncbi:MAG: hypothetical protein A3I75_04530 [Deltaproteobacteria bacterium RIFCSPLOWO2_02_FULL_50_16]|nr:MAG: hypothetical protein A2053_00895 [Deltaproteobacteria bacterium GWA2_50_8]OGQ57085.1 MAG: hypothetical protein A3I75_04530 [Deltaproteobacteria bacterium RIFCSPLOWO2_02_FULL_50_16]OGQ66206.1 MAG: hypothetical protein A3F89_07010 [Deltaproteobacteria bacterium RIFCSPLOWO2_12_FULL_50_11]
MKIVLFQPDIPQNTGNIGRLCVATQTPLFLVKPLGFSLNDSHLKRAGLDYWKDLELILLEDRKAFETHFQGNRIWYFTTKGQRSYTEISYESEDVLVFGSETRGFPPDIYQTKAQGLYTIPMTGPVRSLNLATAVGIVLYEGLRQLQFGEMDVTN